MPRKRKKKSETRTQAQEIESSGCVRQRAWSATSEDKTGQCQRHQSGTGEVSAKRGESGFRRIFADQNRRSDSMSLVDHAALRRSIFDISKRGAIARNRPETKPPAGQPAKSSIPQRPKGTKSPRNEATLDQVAGRRSG